MKRTAASSLIAVALAFASVAAESTPTPSASPATPIASAGGKGIAALRQAAEANQYLFVFFYEKDDDATRTARKTFDAAVQKITPATQSVAVDRSAPAEAELVAKFGVDRAPMPLVLVCVQNGRTAK